MPIIAMVAPEQDNEDEKHPHAPAGTPAGGQFTKNKGGGSAKKAPTKKKAPARRPARKAAPAPAAPAARAPGPPGSARLNLKRGGQNDAAEVRNLQALLAGLGAKVAQDGQYGPETEAAVKAAQAKLGMKPTGRASSSLIRRMADAHALSPCVGGKVSASAADEDEPDAERVAAASASGLALTLWSDSTVWLSDDEDDLLELARDEAVRVVAAIRNLGDQDAGEFEVSDWLTLYVTDDGDVSLVAEDGEVEVDLPDPDELADDLAKFYDLTPVTAAAGADTTPGHDELHHYWVAGAGLARWRASPTPWTTLVTLLSEHVGPAKAKVFASKWYKDVFGIWVGERKGKNPLGPEVRAAQVDAKFNPDQPRNPHSGEWMGDGLGIPKQAKKSLTELFDVADKDEGAALDAARAAFDGKFGGLTAEVSSISVKIRGSMLSLDGSIRNVDGKQVGRFQRILARDREGNLYVMHVLLEIDDPNIRGQGFAEQFNDHAEGWYRESGVQRIQLRADIDVGGYAWARAGYDWRGGVPEDVKMRMQDIGGRHPEVVDLLRRIREGDPPTPYEISQLGRTEQDIGPDASWIGKDIMLGSDWEGVKWLS